MKNLKSWYRGGSPWIWLNAAAVSVSLIMVFGLLGLIAARGLVYFWPANIVETYVQDPGGQRTKIIAEVWGKETINANQVRDSGVEIPDELLFVDRYLFKVGNRDQFGSDFKVVVETQVEAFTYPEDILKVERREWGNFYGKLKAVKEKGQVVAEGEGALAELQKRLARVLELHEKIKEIEKSEIGAINYKLERLRLNRRALELDNELTPDAEKVSRRSHH